MAKPAIEQLKDAILIDSADSIDLDRIGGNYNLKRPKYNSSDDDLARRLIPKLVWTPKTPLNLIHAILTAFFGESSTAAWRVFQIRPNQIILEIPISLAPLSDLTSATYLQRELDPIVINTTVSANHTIGSTTLNVTSTAPFAASGTLVLGNGLRQEWIKYSAKVPTQFTLVGKTLKPHSTGETCLQVPVQPYTTSYLGDYFSSKQESTTLPAGAVMGSTSLVTSGGVSPNTDFYFYVDMYGANRERHYGRYHTSTSTIQIIDDLSPVLLNNHAIGTKVILYDLKQIVDQPSSTTVGSHPIILYDDSLVRDLKTAIDLVKASGIEVLIERTR